MGRLQKIAVCTRTAKFFWLFMKDVPVALIYTLTACKCNQRAGLMWKKVKEKHLNFGLILKHHMYKIS
jgi:hypothetical protein